jgi:hypothetical protein
MRKRITLLVAALVMALTMAFGGVAFADPNCTGPKDERPGACHETGGPGPSNFVAGGGGSLAPNH